MAKLYNLAGMTTATTGTGTLTLGAALPGLLSFQAAGIQNGDVVTYSIRDGAHSEIGRGTYTASGTTLTRSVLNSTNSDNPINLSGNAEVRITAAAEDIVRFVNGVAPDGDGNVAILVREMLTANRTYYVRTDGNDNNNGLSNTSGGAFATIQKAVDVAAALDLSIYSVTIQVGAGTYTAGAVLKSVLGAVYIVGDQTTPANVVIQPAAGACFTAVSVQGRYLIAGFKTITTGGAIQYSIQGSFVELGHNEYGDAAGSGIHIFCGLGGRILAGNTDYTISGTEFGWHIFLDNNSFLYSGNRTITFTGNPTFTEFVRVTGGANLRMQATFSGSVAAGKKYDVRMNGTAETGGSTYPGPTAGTTQTGGQFV